VEQKLREVDGIQRKGLILLMLLKLKQICHHPMQFLQDGSDFTPERSRNPTSTALLGFVPQPHQQCKDMSGNQQWRFAWGTPPIMQVRPISSRL
jgi:hypothetical protein